LARYKITGQILVSTLEKKGGWGWEIVWSSLTPAENQNLFTQS